MLSSRSRSRVSELAGDNVIGAELYGIQILRAAAAVAVVAHHTLEQSNGVQGRFSPDWMTTAGAAGVDIFFVISGFIMLHVSFRPGRASIPPASFLVKRASRIYPIYWLCCLAMLLASGAGFLRHHSWNVDDILASFVLLPSGNPLINVSWTLVYEMYFYLVFALMLCFKSMKIAVIGTILAIVSMEWVGSLLPTGRVRSFFVDPVALEFCLGLLLAGILMSQAERKRQRPVRILVCLVGICLVATAPLYVAHSDTAGLHGFPRLFAWGLPATLIVATSLDAREPTTSMSRFAVLVGDASYALYLTHVFVMIGYGRLLKIDTVARIDQLVLVPVVVAVSIAIALPVHLLVERPLLALIRTRILHLSNRTSKLRLVD